ncbi:DUF3748 domain-containing protein [Alienimonas chondri]|uniref:Translocation protein TolB n=1 Tax=Alienimonas chondri TaxID=2681879 RepID=A0ABX1VA48_9PLAN|nr:DUF3748 domain-containing protein [Alienimonas chondri]NNJ24380.1 hypothetical protein [Alienimonas chondri]
MTIPIPSATGHVLANRDCWTEDSRWLLYDLRTDETVFDGRRIERVDVATGRIETLYEAPPTAACGVPTTRGGHALFLRGPENPTDDWAYAAWHRFGMTVPIGGPATILDARDLSPPRTPGALRGGTHLHTFSLDGRRVASTYEDHLLAVADDPEIPQNRRVVAVTWPIPTGVPADHPRNHDGRFTAVVTEVADEPRPGSDEIARAYSDAWLPDSRGLAFFGEVRGEQGEAFSEVFKVELPDVPVAAPGRPLEGTPTTRPNPPAGARQIRLTFTGAEKHPGVSGPRHWPVSSPTGEIAFYRTGADGRVRVCLINSGGGAIREVTDGRIEPTSACTWSPDGARIAFIGDGSVCTVDVVEGRVDRLTANAAPGPTPHACVFAPDGSRIAYMQRVGDCDQLFVVPAGENG